MADENILQFERTPALVPAYLKALARRRSRFDPQTSIPHIEACLTPSQVSREHLLRYRRLCGFAASDVLPVTYPHVLAFPLQMAVMTHPDFPLPLAGLIHLHNRITVTRPVEVRDRLALAAHVEGHRETDKGIEFDLVTCATDSSAKTPWMEISTMLWRGGRKKTSSGQTKSRETEDPNREYSPEREETWSIPADTGRRYARVAGDYNPIHLSRPSARLFGFPRAIATGMWTAARVSAALQPELEAGECDFLIAFKKPVFLPANVVFRTSAVDHDVKFRLTNTDGQTLHLIGEVQHANS